MKHEPRELVVGGNLRAERVSREEQDGAANDHMDLGQVRQGVVGDHRRQRQLPGVMLQRGLTTRVG